MSALESAFAYAPYILASIYLLSFIFVAMEVKDKGKLEVSDFGKFLGYPIYIFGRFVAQ